MSDGAGSWHTLSSVFLKDQEEHSTQAIRFRIQWPAWFSLSDLPQNIFCKVNSLFSLLYHHVDLDLVQALHRADICWSEILNRSDQWKIRRT
jgi:hypothetical protein